MPGSAVSILTEYRDFVFSETDRTSKETHMHIKSGGLRKISGVDFEKNSQVTDLIYRSDLQNLGDSQKKREN